MARKKSGNALKTQGNGVSDDTDECIALLMEEALEQSERITELEATVVGLQVVVAALAVRGGIVEHGDN